MKKIKCERVNQLSTEFLLRHGYFQRASVSGSIRWTWPNGYSDGGVQVSVDAQNRWMDCSPKDREGVVLPSRSINFQPMQCYFGGARYWFTCPLKRDGKSCGRRCGVLYLLGGYFGCRKCHGLAYRSTQQTHTGRNAAAFRFIHLDASSERAYEKMRVKFWRGAPTKRHRRWMKRYRTCTEVANSLLSSQTSLFHKYSL